MTPAEILDYAAQHHVRVAAEGGKLILESPSGDIPAELVEAARRHKPDLLVDALIRDACKELAVTPTQFRAICTPEDLEDIRGGGTPPEALRVFAAGIAEGIQSGRIAFHPSTGALVKHDYPRRA